MKKLKFAIDYVPTTEEYDENTTDEAVLADFNKFFKDNGIDVTDTKVIGSLEWPEVQATIPATDEAVKAFFDAYNGKEDNDVTSIEELKDMYDVEVIE